MWMWQLVERGFNIAVHTEFHCACCIVLFDGNATIKGGQPINGHVLVFS